MRWNVAVLAAVLAGVLLAGCEDPPPPKTDTTPAAAAGDSKPPALALPSDMVAAVPAGRGTPAVTVHFALGGQPAVGMSLPVKIAIVPRREFTSLRASFEAGDGVVMSAGKQLAPQEAVTADKVFNHQLTLQPSREGMFMVTAAVETEGDEGTVTRIFSIPLIVHAAKPSSSAAPAASPAGSPPAAAPPPRS